MLAVYAKGGLDGKSFISVWDTLSPSQPFALLVADCDLSCACFSPGTTSYILAGSHEGNVLIWDLRAAVSARGVQAAAQIGTSVPLRFPSLSTHLTAARAQMHTSTIVAVLSVPTRLPGTHEEAATQFASVDDRGLVSFWVLTEVGEADSGASSVRLVCSRCISVWDAGDLKGSSTAAALDIEVLSMDELLNTLSPGPSVRGISFLPWEPNQFIVQTSAGGLLRHCRFGSPSHPKSFSPDTLEAPSTVNCVNASSLGYFLAGCADGSVRLYNDAYGLPVKVWRSAVLRSHLAQNGRGAENLFDAPGIVQLHWSPRRPAVFFVLDSAGALHAFDLLESVRAPVVSEQLSSSDSGRSSTALSFSVSHFPACPSFMAVTVHGVAQFRRIHRALTTPLADEVSRLGRVFEELM